MWPDLKEEMELELAQLRRLADSFAPLFEKVKTAPPDPIEIVALAGFLHSFYNGVENILGRAALFLDGDVPRGEAWHRLLLDRMRSPGAAPRALISQAMYQSLLQFLQFRHVFRHAYAFELQWNKMAPLVSAVPEIMARLEAETQEFLQSIEPRRE